MSIVTRHYIVKENGRATEADIEVYENDEVPDGTVINFLSKDEITDDLVNRVLNGDEKVDIKTKSVEELNCLTTSLGSFIRNTYGLWLIPHPYANGRKSSAENYAEKISKEIIEMIQQRLA